MGDGNTTTTKYIFSDEHGHLSFSYTNLLRLLFSGKGCVTCAFDKYKDYLENYYVLKPFN